MESLGTQTYRLFRPIIDNYVRLFVEAETDWLYKVGSNILFQKDFPFVSNLNEKDRIAWWFDKMNFFAGDVLIISLIDLQSRYCHHNHLHIPIFLLSRCEEELLFCIYCVLSENEYLQINVPTLYKCLENVYRVFLI